VPGPDHSLGNNRSDTGRPLEHPAGLTSSRMGTKANRSTRSAWGQLSSRAIPALSPRRRVRAKLPGCRYPGVAARRAQGGADAQVQPQLKLNRGDPIHYEFTWLGPVSDLPVSCGGS
jgi:hypothetical protein